MTAEATARRSLRICADNRAVDATTSLAPAIPTDFHFIRALASDQRVVEHVRDGKPWTDEYLQQRWEDALNAAVAEVWFIARDENGVQVGLLSLTPHGDAVQVGYWVDPRAWRRGHATRMLRLALEVCATQWPDIPQSALVQPRNAASLHILERAGFAVIAGPNPGAEPAAVLLHRAPDFRPVLHDGV